MFVKIQFWDGCYGGLVFVGFRMKLLLFLLWLMEVSQIGFLASSIRLGNKLMWPCKISYQLSVLPGFFSCILLSTRILVNEDLFIANGFSVCSLAVIFGAGLVTSLSPCTLSVLPLTLGYIGNSLCFFWNVCVIYS